MKKIFFSHFFVCAAALTFITFLTGCFNNTLTAPKNTSVSFTIDAATVRQLTGQVSGLHRSARAAEDEHPAQQDQIFIEVSLCGDDEQTQTELLAGEVRMTFDGVLVGAKVYAKAQIYKYIDEEKTQKFLIYRGQSKSITVNNYSNLLSIKLDNANVIVTFNSNGGSAVEQISVPSGVAIEEPDYPVKPEGKKKYDRENYAFMGWYTDEELTVPYNFAKPVTDDLTLYAKWLPDFVRLEGETVSDSLVPGRSTKIRDIFIADHEVTRAEYKEITGKDAGVNQAPANVSDPTSLPVENVSWYYAIVYCNLLSIKEGLTPCYKINDSVDPADWGNVPEVSNADWNNVSFSMVADGYRLPTESEWTFIEAKSRRDSVELSKLEWYSENSSGTTHISKDKLANELCICGVLGNVSEWCFDWYEESVAATNGATGPSAGTSRVVRGGSFNSEGNAESLAALRTSMTPQSKNKYTGFRVVRTIVYKFKVDTNNVTLDPDNGTDVQIQVIVEGDSAIQPANPSRTGYIFEGWCISGTSTVYNFNSPVLQDVKLKAKWTPITYTIKYEMGATTSATTMSDQPFTYDVELELRNNAFTPPSGYQFGGWTIEEQTEVPATVVPDYLNKQRVKNLSFTDGAVITLYAIWVDKAPGSITYNLSDYDVTTLTPVTYLPSQSVSLPDSDVVTRTGYIFDGWYEADDYSGAAITSWNVNDKEGDVELWAKWDPITYKIQFYPGEASGTAYTQTISYDETVQLMACNFNVAGKNFAGWSTSSSSTTVTYTDEQSVSNLTTTDNEVISLYAIWSERPSHSITYNNINGISGISNTNVTTYLESQNITISDVTGTRNGYTFGGWYDSHDADNNGTGNKITGWSADEKNVDIELWAQWNIITYTIDWELDDGGWYPATFTPDTSYDVTQAIELPDSTKIKKTGYNFAGWYISDPDTTTTGWSAGQKYEDITINAKWTPGTVTYKVEHYFQPLNGSTDTDDYEIDASMTQTGIEGTTGEQTSVASQNIEGFTSQTVVQQTIAADSSTVVKIYYNRKTITYTFEKATGETWPDTETPNAAGNVIRSGLFGTTFTAPRINKTAYNLNKWSPDEGTELLDTTTTKTFGSANRTYTATWTAEEFMIAYSANGVNVSGFTPSPVTFTIEDGIVTLHPTIEDNIHNDDCYFDGWYTDTTYTTQVTTIDATVEENRTTWTLFAKWVYKIKYIDSISGEEISVEKYLVGTTPTVPDNPVHDGYVFDKWYEYTNFADEFTFDHEYTGFTSAYARFINTIYVEDSTAGSGNNENDGTRSDAPVASVEKAVELITEKGNSGADWIIKITGPLYGPQKVPDTLTTDSAASLTIQGGTPNNANDMIDAQIGDTAVSGGSALMISTTVPVTIETLKITGGNTTGNGGGINVSSVSTVTLGSGALITGNKAAQAGGGVSVNGNAATPPNIGKLVMLIGSEISDNHVPTGNNLDYGGGGIFNKGIVVMRGGDIIGNSSKMNGGGVFNSGYNGTGKFYMSGSSYIGDASGDYDPKYASNEEGKRSNWVQGSSSGGGIYNHGGIVKLGYDYNLSTGVESEETLYGGLYYNYAYNGGGIYNNVYTNPSSYFEMNSGYIMYNGAYFGAGVYNYDGSTFDMSGGEIKDNQAHRNDGGTNTKGGAVYAAEGFSMSGDAYIPASSSYTNNLIYLPDEKCITIKGKLTSIFPESLGGIELDSYPYTSGTRVFIKDSNVSAGDFTSSIQKFTFKNETSLYATVDGDYGVIP